MSDTQARADSIKKTLRGDLFKSPVVMGLDSDVVVEALEATQKPFQYVESDDWKVTVRDLHAAINLYSTTPRVQRGLLRVVKKRLNELANSDSDPSPEELREVETLTKALLRSMRVKRSRAALGLGKYSAGGSRGTGMRSYSRYTPASNAKGVDALLFRDTPKGSGIALVQAKAAPIKLMKAGKVAKPSKSGKTAKLKDPAPTPEPK